MTHRELKTPAGENPIGELFAQFPELNTREVARQMGINETLMSQYINGKKSPSFDRAIQIENYLHQLGKALMNAKL